MTEEELDAGPAAGASGWRRGWASVGAVLATIALVGLIVMVTLTNKARDRALDWERHTYDVVLLTRTVDASIARSEAALGRYVLDEQRATGTLYYDEWRLAARQIDQLRKLVHRDPAQASRVADLTKLFEARGTELTTAAGQAAEGEGSGGVPYFYQAGLSKTGPALRAKLDDIARNEQEALRRRMAETSMFTQQADELTSWLSWLGVLIGLAAIVLGFAAFRAISQWLIARREADDEFMRAADLEHAVQARTRELREANERLREEAAERAAAEAQLHQVQKMEAVGQLTGGIAHDFNNMLAVIVGGLDLAKRKLGISPADAEAQIDHAMEGAVRAAALTRRLLAFARSEPLLPKGIAPADLVQNMLDLIDRAIGERIQVETRLPKEGWHVWADSSQLENAILNLCVNARDAMSGEGQLVIAVDNVTLQAGEVGKLAAGDYVEISVEDDGCGIAPEHLSRVMEPFFTTKPVGKGTGLGLSQIFGFARQSGGDIAIRSEVGGGTRVSIYLPRASSEAVQAAMANDGNAFAEPVFVPDHMAVLVVEDDPRVSRATAGALKELGYEPVPCANGREALAILVERPDIALLITDVMMPEMTGPQLARIVSDRYPDVAILFVTGYVGEAGDAEDLSGYDILRKPFTVAALATAVHDTLARRASGSPFPSASAAAE
ncbi:response regulator [Allosphingosinicella flava]|uniref:histidine kinase n=1 Tax=Allosphingosinicella flava TaxID=2771430 RepID=A0A7T2GJN4_9SPHN|nr:ATP-binding protein [Sphingosinicella flava]QPQ55071.1 response regulator [Sphingosinicella flava]